MMTGIRPYGSCGRDLHVLDPETDLDLGGDRGAVLEIDEVDLGLRGRRISRRGGLLRAGLDSSIHGNCYKYNKAEACKSIHKPLPRQANMSLEDQQAGAGSPDHAETPRSLYDRSSGAIRKAPRRASHSRPPESAPNIEIRPQLAYSAAVMRIDAAIRCFAICLVVVFGLLAEARAAEPRVALVIGNGAYRSGPELDNNRNDADDISEQLKRVGFAVIDGRDLDRSAMYAALGRFAQRVRGTDAGLVYYSGHGMQINGQNYLVPVDLKLAGSSFTPFDLVKLDDVVEALNYTAGVKIMVLDACRDNPFANSVADNKSSRGVATRGLAKIERSQGMLIAYSTQSNSVAADGVGRNSPFTAALVREIQVPGLEVATVFRRVAINVNRETQGAQTPELSVSLLQDFYLNPRESDVDGWKKLGPSASAADLKRFISAFPESVMLDAARARLDAIENASERERLAREYADKERRLRQDLEAAEAGYKKAMSELSGRRERDEREKLADTKASQIPAAATAPALAGIGSSNAPAAAGPSRADIERERVSKELAAKEQAAKEQAAKEQVAKAEQERLASQVAAYEADKARLAEERQTLERVMTERLARAQAERERAEKRVVTETARLPVYALEQSRTTAPPAPRRRAAASCQEINARAQLGELSETDRDVLRNCR